MSKPLLEILIIFLLLIINGIFAMSEIAIVSARKARLQQQAEEGSSKARAALALATSPNDFLSTVQIGITLVGILAGALGGATIAEELAATLNKVHWLAPYSEAVSVGLVVLGITYFSLIIGELVPKRAALSNPERVAAIVAGPMRRLSVIFSPLVRLLSRSTDVVIKLSGIRPSTEPSVTEEEIKVMVEQGAQVGVLKEAEQEMIEGVLRLGETASHIGLGRIDWFQRMDAPGSAALAAQAAVGKSPAGITQDPAEIVKWLEASWQMIDLTLKNWTTADLARTYLHTYYEKTYAISYQWTIWRILAHDLYHGGELAAMLGMQGVAIPDLGDHGGHLTEPPLAEPY